MSDVDLKILAERVCDWNIGPYNNKVEGMMHTGNLKFKPFLITGPSAKRLIKMLIKLEETNL